jgi:hypothetical protein
MPAPGNRAEDRRAGPGGERVALDSPVDSVEHAVWLELDVLDRAFAQDLVTVAAPPDLVREERLSGLRLDGRLGEKAEVPLNLRVLGEYLKADSQDLEPQRGPQRMRPSWRSWSRH